MGVHLYFFYNNQKEFLEFVLSKYIEVGIGELDPEKIPVLLKIKYQAIHDATDVLGGVDKIRETFINFQKHLFAITSN
ncbi:MAG: type I restriction-modification enzyme R subunit C-terminal domain-containing protein [Nanoarchaeota archaeon]